MSSTIPPSPFRIPPFHLSLIKFYAARSNNLCSSKCSRKASRAFSTTALRKRFSSGGSRSAFPTGWTIPEPGMIRFEPTIKATGVIVDIWAVGNPFRSNSFVITAPQRVLVPHVEVKITASTPSAFMDSAIPRAMFSAFFRDVATPAVVYILSWTFPMTLSFSISRTTSRGTSRLGS